MGFAQWNQACMSGALGILKNVSDRLKFRKMGAIVAYLRSMSQPIDQVYQWPGTPSKSFEP
jgi:hypothetical protein